LSLIVGIALNSTSIGNLKSLPTAAILQDISVSSMGALFQALQSICILDEGFMPSSVLTNNCLGFVEKAMVAFDSHSFVITAG